MTSDSDRIDAYSAYARSRAGVDQLNVVIFNGEVIQRCFVQNKHFFALMVPIKASDGPHLWRQKASCLEVFRYSSTIRYPERTLG